MNQMASTTIFGTLLSSQGTNAHHNQSSNRPRGNCSNLPELPRPTKSAFSANLHGTTSSTPTTTPDAISAKNLLIRGGRPGGTSHRLALETGATITGASDDTMHLIEQVSRSDQSMKVRPDRVLPLVRVLAEIGEATQIAGRTLLGLLGFFGAVCIVTVPPQCGNSAV